MYHSKTVRVLAGTTLLASLGLGTALILVVSNQTTNHLQDTPQVAEVMYSTPVVEPVPSTPKQPSVPPVISHNTASPSFDIETEKEPEAPKVTISKPVIQTVRPVTVTTPVVTPSETPSPIRTSAPFDTEAMLGAHNAVRSKKGLAPLLWSNMLAQSSQKWGDRLTSNDCEFYHDPDTEFGENLFWKWISDSNNRGLISTPEDAVTWWADEERIYNYTKNTCKEGKDCGHYTQIVWADTAQVGCSVSTCFDRRNDNTQTDFWVCRYNPPGNIEGEKPY